MADIDMPCLGGVQRFLQEQGLVRSRSGPSPTSTGVIKPHPAACIARVQPAEPAKNSQTMPGPSMLPGGALEFVLYFLAIVGTQGSAIECRGVSAFFFTYNL